MHATEQDCFYPYPNTGAPWRRQEETERARLNKVNKALAQLNSVVVNLWDAERLTRNGRNVQRSLDVRNELNEKARGLVLDIMQEVDLKGLQLWGNAGKVGRIGGVIFAGSRSVMWFKSGQEPDFDFIMTMAHSWLRRPGSKILPRGGHPTAHAYDCTLRALRWALEHNGLLPYPEGQRANRRPPTPSRPAGHAAELTEGRKPWMVRLVEPLLRR
jgi:hypothetical protein